MHLLEAQVSTSRDQQHAMQQEHLQRLQKENHLESELKQTGVRLENGQERYGQMSEKRKHLSLRMEELLNQLTEKQGQVEGTTQLIDSQTTRIMQADERIQALNENMHQAREELDSLQKEMMEHKA